VGGRPQPEARRVEGERDLADVERPPGWIGVVGGMPRFHIRDVQNDPRRGRYACWAAWPVEDRQPTTIASPTRTIPSVKI
jgi:hypothetical protein